VTLGDHVQRHADGGRTLDVATALGLAQRM
jgi:hypothetical protein